MIAGVCEFVCTTSLVCGWAVERCGSVWVGVCVCGGGGGEGGVYVRACMVHAHMRVLCTCLQTYDTAKLLSGIEQ